MIKPNYVKLNCTKIRTLIDEGDYRMWWLAERVEVHVTTVRRWLKGSIASVSPGHAVSLAEALSVPKDSICL